MHHIVPWQQCKAHKYENLIALCPNCHRRADREDIDRQSLRKYKANLRFAHDRFSQLEVDLLFDLYRKPPGAGVLWPAFLELLIKRVIDAKYVDIAEAEDQILVANQLGDLRVTPNFYSISQAGRAFINSLGVELLS